MHWINNDKYVFFVLEHIFHKVENMLFCISGSRLDLFVTLWRSKLKKKNTYCNFLNN